MSEPVTVEGDNIMERKESEEEEDSATEDLKSPCPREPDHKKVKVREYSDTPEHGETGIKYESLRARIAGSVDYLQKVGNPERRKIGTRLEAKPQRMRMKKMLL